MAVELEHPFSTARSLDESFATILDLDTRRPVCRGRQRARGPPTLPPSGREIKVKMGAMSMTFTGTVEIVEQDPRRAPCRDERQVERGRRPGVCERTQSVFALVDGGGTIHTDAQITGKAASMGEGRRCLVLDALITDFAGKLGAL